MKFLILESSTTSAKAMVYDADSGKWNVVSKPYGFALSSDGTQNVKSVFEKTSDLAKELVAETGCANDVQMVLLSATWHSVFFSDSEGNPLSPLELWSYTGAAPLCSQLRADKNFSNNYYHTSGCVIHSMYPYFKILEKRKGGNIPAGCVISGQGEYNFFRLTGQWATTLSMASGTGLININISAYDKNLLGDLGIDESQLPRIAGHTETFPLSKDGAKILGLTEGIPVVPAYPDGALNQIGAGALGKGMMTFSVGTSIGMRLATDDALLPKEPSLWSYFSYSKHLLGAATSGACNCQDWVKQTLFPTTSYADIENRLDPMRDTPVFLPFLFGERSPGWKEDRASGFLNLKPEHNAFDMYQSVLEGILFSAYQCYKIIVDTVGEPKTIKLSGGILHSEFWTNMCADIFGKTMDVDETDQGSIMGCVAIGLYLAGKIDSLENYAPKHKTKIMPNERNHMKYLEKFAAYCFCYETIA